MNICIFNVTSTMAPIGSAEVGGVEAYAFRLGEALIGRGHRVVLYGGVPKPGIPAPSTRVPLRLFPYVETQSVPNLGTRFRRLVQRLHFAWIAREAICRESFDAILVFKPYDLVTAGLWRRQGVRARLILGVHGPEFYPFDRRFIGSVDGFYAVSRSTAEAVERRYRIACPVIPNFIDLAAFPWRERNGTDREKLVIAVGRLVGWKGMASLVRAFARISREVPSARLTIIGDGPERENLLAEARRLGVGAVVELTGRLEEPALAKYRARAALFVQPSIGYESFSITTLEALASGVRGLVSSQVGIADWFRGEEALEVFPSGDEEALAGCMRRLLAEEEETSRVLRRRAREIVEARFSAEAVIPQILALLEGRPDRSARQSSSTAS
jgi:glycosyltransferase involved in cell wall biosynthesis